jgi:hypothetical protein
VSWYGVALAYFLYLVAASLARPEFRPARARLAAGALGASALAATGILFPHRPEPLVETLLVVVPAVVLLIGYKLTGLLFVRTDLAGEAWLRRVDDRLLHRPGLIAWYRESPFVVSELLELSYFLVYAAVPAGAAVLAVSGFADRVERFWVIVLTAEFGCYGVLPWLQTRPPMLIEAAASPAASGRWRPMRRLNQFIAASASIRAATVPSGHVAGAVVTALVVGESMPLAGTVFMVLAVLIALASVLGRYHYLLDTVLGAFVAWMVWLIFALLAR